jgi:hypothetical protein
MKACIRAAVLAALPFSVLAGCSTTTVVRGVQQSRMTPFAEAQAGLRPQPADAMRLYIYRPQTVVGMWGNAIVLVDGKHMGNPANPTVENLLLPGAVFVVDTPVKVTRVGWVQSGRGEETELVLDLDPAQSRVWYLRWDLRPTYGYLRRVDDAQAQSEIAPLGLSGYVNLLQP